LLKTTDARLITDPDCPMMIELIGYVIAPKRALPWEIGNGMFATKEMLDLPVRGKELPQPAVGGSGKPCLTSRLRICCVCMQTY